jgi:thiol-disulfide isomerase/thioredoxin
MKRILILLIPVMIVAGCKNKDRVRVDGIVKDNPVNYIYINKVDVDTPVLLDSSKIRKDGSFRFSVKATVPDFYQVGYSGSDFITLLAEPGEKIHLSFNSNHLYNNYTVTGSKGSELIRELDLKLLGTKIKLDSLSNIYKEISNKPSFATEGPILENEYQDLVKQQRMYNIGFIIKNISSLAAIKALYQKFNEETYVLYEGHDLQYLKIVTDSLKRHYPESKHTKALVKNFEKEMNNLYARQLEKITSSIPETKLDPNLKDINGKRIALSSLRGKYVLLAFWSANSKDCIAENLQLKEFYKLYHRKGFEIYQINVDENESQWKAAVKFDELPWINTKEDDPTNPKIARLFNIRNVPSNYLFDPKGSIIGSNLHGRNLQIKLNQLFPN